MYKIWSAIENVFSKMRKYPVPTKEEAEELKRLRQEAGMTIPQVAEALHTNQFRISPSFAVFIVANPCLISM